MSCNLDPNTQVVIVDTMIRLAKEHRKHCKGSSCKINLIWILTLLEQSGINWLTSEQRSVFL